MNHFVHSTNDSVNSKKSQYLSWIKLSKEKGKDIWCEYVGSDDGRNKFCELNNVTVELSEDESRKNETVSDKRQV